MAELASAVYTILFCLVMNLHVSTLYDLTLTTNLATFPSAPHHLWL